MAQTKGLVKVLQFKLANITSQKDQLHGVLDDFVNKMTSKAREMLENDKQDIGTLKDLNSTMDTVLGYLCDITTQMDDVPSTTVVEASDQLSTQASSSLLSSSLSQLSSASLPIKSQESAESEKFSELCQRIQVLEMALTTCHNETSLTNSDMNEIRDKMDKLENHIQMVETSDSQNMATIKEQASKLGKVEKKLKKMKEEEQERWSQIDSIHTDVESLKDDQRDNQQLVKIQGLEKHMETLTSQCDSLQDQVEKIEISTQATDEQVQELIQTSTATSRSLEELTSRVEDTERSVRGCVAQRERDENRRREMEDRVAVLEAQRQKDLDHYTKELEETNSLHKAVCQLVDQRVTPLRRLQRMLNNYHKQVEKREEISTRLDDVVKEVEDISTQLDKHVRSVVPARVGFTAYHSHGPVPNKGSRITDFTNVFCNEGNYYNPHMGEFICPAYGLYMISTTLWQFKDGVVNVHIKRQCVSIQTPPTVVCRAATRQDKTSCCDVAVTRLQQGDIVYVELFDKSGNPELSSYSSLSCFQIG